MHNKYIIQRFLVSATTDLHIFYSKLNEEISFKIRFFSAKKKKKKESNFEIEASSCPRTIFKSRFSEKPRSGRAAESGSAFQRLPLSMHLPNPPPLEPPLPPPSAPFLRRVARLERRRLWWEDEARRRPRPTGTDSAPLPFFYV